MKSRVLVFGLVMWLGVVAVGSGATWLVIDRVGRDVVSTRADTSDAGASGGTASRTLPPATVSARPSRKPRPTSTPPATAAPPAPGSPTTTATAPPLQSRPTRTPATRPSSPQAPAPSAVTRTWSGSAGRVTVRCTGARIALVSASPADGWRVEAGERGPEEVEVEFKRGAEGGEVHVKARCAGGQPRFAVESDD